MMGSLRLRRNPGKYFRRSVGPDKAKAGVVSLLIVRVHTHVCTHVYVHVDRKGKECTCVYVCTCVRVYVCTCVRVYRRVCVETPLPLSLSRLTHSLKARQEKRGKKERGKKERRKE